MRKAIVMTFATSLFFISYMAFLTDYIEYSPENFFKYSRVPYIIDDVSSDLGRAIQNEDILETDFASNTITILDELREFHDKIDSVEAYNFFLKTVRPPKDEILARMNSTEWYEYPVVEIKPNGLGTIAYRYNKGTRVSVVSRQSGEIIRRGLKSTLEVFPLDGETPNRYTAWVHLEGQGFDIPNPNIIPGAVQLDRYEEPWNSSGANTTVTPTVVVQNKPIKFEMEIDEADECNITIGGAKYPMITTSTKAVFTLGSGLKVTTTEPTHYTADIECDAPGEEDLVHIYVYKKVHKKLELMVNVSPTAAGEVAIEDPLNGKKLLEVNRDGLSKISVGGAVLYFGTLENDKEVDPYYGDYNSSMWIQTGSRGLELNLKITTNNTDSVKYEVPIKLVVQDKVNQVVQEKKYYWWNEG